jgi:hypothetical protein
MIPRTPSTFDDAESDLLSSTTSSSVQVRSSLIFYSTTLLASLSNSELEREEDMEQLADETSPGSTLLVSGDVKLYEAPAEGSRPTCMQRATRNVCWKEIRVKLQHSRLSVVAFFFVQFKARRSRNYTCLV